MIKPQESKQCGTGIKIYNRSMEQNRVQTRCTLLYITYYIKMTTDMFYDGAKSIQ